MTIDYANMKVGQWDITDLVKDPSSKEFSQFLGSIEEQVIQFEGCQQLLHPNISQEEFEHLIHMLESISEKAVNCKQLCISEILRRYIFK